MTNSNDNPINLENRGEASAPLSPMELVIARFRATRHEEDKAEAMAVAAELVREEAENILNAQSVFEDVPLNNVPLLEPQKKRVDEAVKAFIEVASVKTLTVLVNVGEQLAGIYGKTCKSIREKISYVFEMVEKTAGKVIENPVLKKFIESINNFVDKALVKTKSIAVGAKKSVGSFSSKILNTPKNLRDQNI